MDNSKASLQLGTMWGLLVLDVSRINLPGYLENVVFKAGSTGCGVKFSSTGYYAKNVPVCLRVLI